MSGIVGILGLDGAPARREQLEQIMHCLRSVGPDKQDSWLQGQIGLGHALLRTSFEAEHEHQPLSLDGRLWIVADARVDGRAELIDELGRAERRPDSNAPDAELILHAYDVWGHDSVQHLIGDFAFAIWDVRTKQLFCARDQFGVKPFYFASVRNAFLFSNNLTCLLRYPSISTELNDAAIADFLLFGFERDTGATRFAQIKALPPAHCLTISAQAPRVGRYWTLPVDPPIRYKKSREYTEHFSELFNRAVADRLRTKQVGVLMSGGLDSSSIAAVAQRVLPQQAEDGFELRAYTQVFETLIPHDEEGYARLAAEASKIAIQVTVLDQISEPASPSGPRSFSLPMRAVRAQQLHEIAQHSRVVLSGLGGDPAMCPSQRYLTDLLRHGHVGELLNDVGQYLAVRGRLPPLYLRTAFKRRLRRAAAPPFPTWLNRELVTRLRLEEQWAQFHESAPAHHPTRPEAYFALLSPLWPSAFAARDAGALQEAIEFRYPFFDVRLLRFLLAVPPVPWCVHKFILREAMRDVLPEAVRTRPKTPLQRNPIDAALRRGKLPVLEFLTAVPQLRRFVKTEEFERCLSAGGQLDFFLVAFVLELAEWLSQNRPAPARSLPSIQNVM